MHKAGQQINDLQIAALAGKESVVRNIKPIQRPSGDIVDVDAEAISTGDCVRENLHMLNRA